MDMDKDQTTGKIKAKAGAQAVYKDKATGQLAKNKSMSLYRGDKSAVQDALWYEWKKTGFDPQQMKSIEDQYGEILTEHKFANTEGSEMMKGVGFRHQGQSLASKYSTFKPNSQGKWGWSVDHLGLSKETALNLDTYSMSKQDVRTYDELGKGYISMRSVLGDYQLDGSGGIVDGETLIRGTGTEFDDRTRAQVYQGMDRIERIADAVNPQQRMPTAMGRQAVVTEEGEQPVGYGGVSNAPADVQVAAKRFYEIVRPTIVNGGGPASPRGDVGPTTPIVNGGGPASPRGDEAGPEIYLG
jgi:hypothetical protein